MTIIYRPFWLSTTAPDFSASPVAEAVLEQGLEAGLRLAATVRRKVLALTADMDPLRDPSRYLLEVRRILQRYEPDLARTLSDASLLAWLRGGRKVASQVPVTLERPEERRPLEFQPFGLLAGSPPPWEPGPPVIAGGQDDEEEPETELVMIREAARDLASRNIMTRADYEISSSQAKSRAFTVSRLMTEDAVARVREALGEGISKGTTLKKFREALAEDIETGSLGPAHVETIWRTNVLGSYAAGQKKIIATPLVASVLPYCSYNAIHDSRVQAEHLAMEKHGIGGTNIYRIDDPVIRKFWPPWRWNCRCSVIPMTLSRAADKGIEEAKRWRETGLPPTQPAYVDPPPFDLPPGWVTT